MQSFYKAIPPPVKRVLPPLDDEGPPLLSRLQRLATEPPAAVGSPSNSAVQAGWICVALGMLIAWWFPLGHALFSLAMVMAVIAVATHQIKNGLLLLGGAFVGMFVCWIVFAAGILALLSGAARHATETSPRRSASAAVPRTSHPPATFAPVPVKIPVVSRPASVEPTALAENPLRWNDLLLMLRGGYQDDEIIADASTKQLVDPIGPAQVATLRGLGAGDRLIAFLKSQRLYLAPALAKPSGFGMPAVAAAALPVSSVDVNHPTTTNFAARDQQIAALSKQIAALDEAIRRWRAMPRSPSNQQAADDYIKSLDQQRDDLRRQKWQLEGR